MVEKESAAGFGLGLLAGAIVGLAIGFLYAPRSGQETRAMLREKAENARGKAEGIIAEGRERAKKIVEDAKGKAGLKEE